MVKTLTMTCPHCNQVSEIFLSTNACVIVLNCPSCFSPIMYFEKKIFLLSQNQVEAIKGTTQNAAVLKMLDKIAHPSECQAKNTTSKIANVQHISSCNSVPVHKISERAVQGKYICDDDITNLRIELALCNDSKYFIDSM